MVAPVPQVLVASAARRMAGTPARWQRAWRTVAPPLPAAANSGHTDATGSSRPTRPWSTSCRSRRATNALPTEYTSTRVSWRHGRVRVAVGPAADQVHDQLAVDEHGHRGTDLTPVREVGGEGLADRVRSAPSHRPDTGARPAAGTGVSTGHGASAVEEEHGCRAGRPGPGRRRRGHRRRPGARPRRCARRWPRCWPSGRSGRSARTPPAWGSRRRRAGPRRHGPAGRRAGPVARPRPPGRRRRR